MSLLKSLPRSKGAEIATRRMSNILGCKGAIVRFWRDDKGVLSRFPQYEHMWKLEHDGWTEQWQLEHFTNVNEPADHIQLIDFGGRFKDLARMGDR